MTRIPPQGWTIVEIPSVFHENNTGISMEHQIVSHKSMAANSIRCGKVHKAPNDSDIPHFNYFFDSEVEVVPGDIAWWTMNAAQQYILKKNDFVFRENGNTYALIPYKSLVMRQRGNDLMGLNDNVICEPVRDTSSFVAASKPYSGQQHIVVAVPSGKVTYRLGGRTIPDEVVRVNPGDRILTSRPTLDFLESEYHQTLPGRYVVFQSRLISALLTNE